MTCWIVSIHGVDAHAGSIEFFRACSVGIQRCDVQLIGFKELVGVGIARVLETIG